MMGTGKKLKAEESQSTKGDKQLVKNKIKIYKRAIRGKHSLKYMFSMQIMKTEISTSLH